MLKISGFFTNNFRTENRGTTLGLNTPYLLFQYFSLFNLFVIIGSENDFNWLGWKLATGV